MRNFSIFMIACAIACGNFAEAKLTREQVDFIKQNLLNRNVLTAYQHLQNIGATNTKDQLDDLSADSLAQHVIKSYVNMNYFGANRWLVSHVQAGNVLAYESNGGQVIVLKNGRFAYLVRRSHEVPGSIFESHDKVITISSEVIKGLFVTSIKKGGATKQDIMHARNLTSVNIKERLAARDYFRQQTPNGVDYSNAFFDQAGDSWREYFRDRYPQFTHRRSQTINTSNTTEERHTEAQVAMLQHIADHTTGDFRSIIVSLLPKTDGRVYSLYDACRSCREIKWVKENQHNFMCHVFDAQACINGHEIATGFYSQEACNTMIQAMENNLPTGMPIDITVNGNIATTVPPYPVGVQQVNIQLPVNHKLPQNQNLTLQL